MGGREGEQEEKDVQSSALSCSCFHGQCFPGRFYMTVENKWLTYGKDARWESEDSALKVSYMDRR